MTIIDPADLTQRRVYRLLTMLVVPRPIAWVSTLSADGTPNVAPHSFFNVMSSEPPVVHVTSSGEKDTLRNVRDTGEFVINVVTRDLLEQMNLTAADFPAHEDEFAWAGLEQAPSQVVATPRVAASPAALECRLRLVVEIGTGRMIFGDVVRIHVADDLWDDEGRIPPERLDPVGRLGGPNYVMTDDVRELARPTWQDVRST
jgi:flavin reductase (DIM6/NTAB) family NADH-FMN oxidoreductase RutF